MKAELVARLQLSAPGEIWIAERVSWGWFQRGDALPAIALTLISPGRGYTHSGADGLNEPRVRFTIRAETIEEADAIAQACIEEMEAAADVGSTRFHPAQLVAERMQDLTEQAGGDQLAEVQVEFTFFHEEI